VPALLNSASTFTNRTLAASIYRTFVEVDDIAAWSKAMDPG